MKSIGLFFGSFNPIHLGHVNLAEFIFEFSGVDEIWFVVSPQNPLKENKTLIEEHHRLKMVELAIEGKEYLKTSDIEFSLPKPSYTIDTLQNLREKYPQDNFILIIGSDNVAIFDQWKDYETILEEYSILVYPRKNFDFEPFEEKYPDMHLIDEAPLFEISSTEIRLLIQKNEDVSKWIHYSVYQYIKENKLY
jgi:nicotinate-nucleotide adenylyltransferase